jgi:hypothetical protein
MPQATWLRGRATQHCPGCLAVALFCCCNCAALSVCAGKDAKGKAAAAAKAVKKNTWKKSMKPRYSVVFHRPKTLKRTRTPKYTRTR